MWPHECIIGLHWVLGNAIALYHTTQRWQLKVHIITKCYSTFFCWPKLFLLWRQWFIVQNFSEALNNLSTLSRESLKRCTVLID